ncbi:poly-beta-1,6-N-acetyl-D-glucosamine biosynthesis protein PgaD [uncultured Oxalicibacterium sp.]|uniref:poly-beta-1,6-N-acetyl-D-glucosamine biosynthesis protein PgaD n=1 Tax=uncultured Oxalicibacterium sp. TaxID=1168540 RepID=UPI0025F2E842|nr:poly-beta-1,6-N-acetyl-D-glucosamine biosynthesis protein PgaD [uncultured Oxalicibacterium sp.]
MNRRSKARIKLILNAPDKVSRGTKLGSNIVTIVCWIAYIYLWIPLITLVAWWLGVNHAYDELSFARQADDLQNLLLFYGFIVAMLGGSLLLWAAKEYLRFRNSTRRRTPPHASVVDLATYVQRPENEVHAWHGFQQMMALHDEEGRVIGVQPITAPPQPSQ